MVKEFFKKVLRSDGVQSLLGWIGYFYIQSVYRTSRWSYSNRSILCQYIEQQKPFIICFWHGRLMMLPLAWQWSKPFTMLLSEHGDGALIAKVLKHFHIQHTKGSTTRGGAKAVRHLIHFSSTGGIIGITPDGPRGPTTTVSPGTVTLSKWLQADLIPVSYATRRRRILKTWDRFHFPLPFTQGAFIVGTPVPYPTDSETTEKARILLKIELDKITQQADEQVKNHF